MEVERTRCGIVVVVVVAQKLFAACFTLTQRLRGACGLQGGNKAENASGDRRKGVPWTEDEHRLFLMGLAKFGKGDWRSIARNFVTTRTPTQVSTLTVQKVAGSRDNMAVLQGYIALYRPFTVTCLVCRLQATLKSTSSG